MNVGNADLILGDPSTSSFFVFSSCHNHFHFETFAKYELFDFDCNNVNQGFKRGFCIEDTEPISGSAPSCDTFDDCETNQGLSKDCADVYPKSLDCQWIDITGIPNGQYFLKVTLNFDQILSESNFANNSVIIAVEWQGNTILDKQIIPIDLFLENITINVGVPSGFVARNLIQAGPNVTILSTSERLFLVAGHRVVLKPGFRAQAGGKFRALIFPCLGSHEGILSQKRTIELTEKENQEDIIQSKISENKVLLYPHIFKSTIKILYELENDEKVYIAIYNLHGQLIEELVRSKEHPKGEYTIIYNGEGLTSAMYICKILIGSFHTTKKIIKVH